MALGGMQVLAFAGIARPDKFFTTLREAGANVAATRAFPDHHRFSARELDDLLREARAANASLITTAKDAVRLPASIRPLVRVLRVRLEWEKPEQIERLLGEVA